MKKVLAIFICGVIMTWSIQASAQTISTIKCKADSAITYSVYQPANSITQHLPVVFLLDPSARGTFAVSQYKNVADELGVILIGSNNSRNGAINVSLHAADMMITDALSRYPIDRLRIYLAGFSGGARVALAVASERIDIAGIIACSAGLGGESPGGPLPWSFAGTAGTEDFNYVEMQETQLLLSKASSSNSLRIFKGPHSWAPAEVFKRAFLWTDLLHHQDEAKRKIFQELTLADIAHNTSLIEKAELYRELVQVDRDDKESISAFTSIVKNPAFAAAEQTWLQSVLKEGAYQQQIGQNIAAIRYLEINQMKTKSWWKTQLADLNRLLLKHNAADSNYAARQKAYINANASVGFDGYREAKLYEQAGELLNISEVFDPANFMNDYRRALLAGAKHDEVLVLSYLQSSIKKGFANKQGMAKEPAFAFMAGDKRFQELLK